MKNILYVFISTIILVSCNFVAKNNNQITQNCPTNKLLDTTNSEIRIDIIDSACLNFVFWTINKQNFRLDLKNDLGMDWVNTADITPFYWITNDFFCIRFGCGMPCWNDVIFPINKPNKPFVIYNAFWHNQNFVVSQSQTTDNLLIYDLNSGKKIDSIENPINANRSWDTNAGGAIVYNIDTINISHDTLFLGKFDEHNNLKISLRKKIKIKNGA